MKTVQETVEQMKGEILVDMNLKLVPKTVGSFSELHNYVDANEYGGFCVDVQHEKMIAHFGGLDDGGMPQGMLDYINECQADVDLWLKNRRVLISVFNATKA